MNFFYTGDQANEPTWGTIVNDGEDTFTFQGENGVTFRFLTQAQLNHTIPGCKFIREDAYTSSRAERLEHLLNRMKSHSV